MSASPSAARPSARRALASALRGLCARPAALALLLLVRTLQSILTPLNNAMLAFLPAIPFWLVWTPAYYTLLFLLHAGFIRFILTVFVRGDSPRLPAFFEPFTWGFRRGALMALAVGLLYMLTSAAPALLSVLIVYLFRLPDALTSALLVLFSVAGSLLFLHAFAAYALSKGACGLRGLFVGLRDKIAPLVFIYLVFALCSTLFTLLRALSGQPDALPALLRNASTFDILSPLGALSVLAASLLNSLQDAALVFLYERAVPASTSE